MKLAFFLRPFYLLFFALFAVLFFHQPQPASQFANFASTSVIMCKDVHKSLENFSWVAATRDERIAYLENILTRHDVALSPSLFSALQDPGLRDRILHFQSLRSFDKDSFSVGDLEKLTDFLVGQSLKLRYPKFGSVFSQNHEREYYELFEKAVVTQGLTETFSSLGIIRKNSPRERFLISIKSTTKYFTSALFAALDIAAFSQGHIPPLAPVFKRSLTANEKERFLTRAQEVGFEKAFSEVTVLQSGWEKTREKARDTYNWLAKTYSLTMSLVLATNIYSHAIHTRDVTQTQQQASTQQHFESEVDSIHAQAQAKSAKAMTDLSFQSFIESQKAAGHDVDPHSPEMQRLYNAILAANEKSLR